MAHVLIAGKIHDDAVALLRAQEGFTLDVVNEVSLASYAPLMPRADALLLRTQPCKADLMSNSLLSMSFSTIKRSEKSSRARSLTLSSSRRCSITSRARSRLAMP